MSVDEMVQLGLSFGAGTGGFAFLLRALAVSIPKLFEWLRSRARTAEVTAEMVSEFMREMRARVKSAEEGQTECEARYAAALEMIEVLRAEVFDLRTVIETGRPTPADVAKPKPIVLSRLEAVRRMTGDER